MNAAPRASNGRRPRRVFDRAIALAWCRWEILRRTSRYRAEVRRLVEETSRMVGWAPSRYDEHCLADGGVVDRAFDTVVAQHYDEICARYGLTVVMHHEAALSDDDMAAFPVFADTPRRQLTVRDPALLRRVARRGGDVKPADAAPDISPSARRERTLPTRDAPAPR